MKHLNHSFPFRLKPGQLEILHYLSERKSVFSNLPTGYGKSLTYFLPAKEWGWKVWVLSPLISLMEDQKIAAELFGLRARVWGSAKNTEILEQCQITLFSPEKLESLFLSKKLEAELDSGNSPDLLVLDELHCFEQWHDFRPAFEESIGIFVRRFQGIPVLGLSATLSLAQGKEWMKEIGKDAFTVSVGIGRPNLRIRISPQLHEGSLLIDLVERLKQIRSPDSAIVYCETRNCCESYAQLFRSMGFVSYAFHAGRPLDYKKELIQQFRTGRVPILFATSAFGMGIDYGRVRLVVHLSPPSSISQFWQEAGRAGRDGNLAEAVLYLRRSDANFDRFEKKEQKTDFYFLWKMFWSNQCRKVFIAAFLGMQEKICGMCDSCESNFGNPAKKLWWEENPMELKHWVKKKYFSSLKKS